MDLEDELHTLEMTLWTGGPEAYREHCDAEYLVIFPSLTAVMDRDRIARTAKRGRWRNVSIRRLGIVIPTELTAVIAYECDAKRKDGKQNHALVSSGYVRRASGWKLASHQQCQTTSSPL